MSLTNMKLGVLLLMITYLLIQSTILVSSVDVQEKPDCVYLQDSDECNSTLCQQCHILMWYVNQTEYFSGTHLLFFEGNHILSENSVMKVNDVKDFHMTGKNTEPKRNCSNDIRLLTTKVVCEPNAGFIFNNSNFISIRMLQFEGCGVNIKMGLQHSRSALKFHSCSNIILYQVIFTNSFGFGLAVLNMSGNFHISRSEFVQSKPFNTSRSTSDSLELFGNAIFQFDKSDARSTLDMVFVVIEKSNFLHASGGPFNSDICNGIGLCLLVHQPSVNITLSSIIVKNNTGGGNIAIDILNFDNSKSSVNIHNSVIEQGIGYHGGGLQINMNYSNESKQRESNQGFIMGENIVTITNTSFQGNSAKHTGGGVYINYHEHIGLKNITSQFVFHNCTFKNNFARIGAAVHVAKHSVLMYNQRIVPQLVVTFNTCHIEQNHLVNYLQQKNEDGVFDILSVEDIRITNTNFTDNDGTALLIVNSAVIFENMILFEGNSAQYGGAIKLCQSSVLFLKEHSHVKFKNNHAYYAGGAIYAEKQCLQVAPPCFFQPDVNTNNISELGNIVKLEFINNSASIAGSAIYGGSIDNCFTYSLLMNSNNKPGYYNSVAVYHEIFKLTNSSSNVSPVTSDPYGICLCSPSVKQTTNCTSRTLNINSKFAGERFIVSVSAVGQMNGSVPALISADKPNVNDTSFNISDLSCSGGMQCNESDPNDTCQTLHLVIFSTEYHTNVIIELSVHQSNLVSERANYYKLPKLELNVTLTPCPWLFQLNSTHGCDCHSLSKYSITCDINTRTITKLKPTDNWIGCHSSNITNSSADTCDSIMVGPDCSGRCSNATNFSSSSILDGQCSSGRTGILCSSCRENYVQSLGRSTCIANDVSCSPWKTVFLLFAFLLAGLLFVCFIAVFNFTVSEGTAHGLLFYANLVHANGQIFFPDKYLNQLANVLRIFIAWLNLDFGFEVCFYAGMDAYQKIWLEFVFLLYILVLGLLIIYASHKYIRVTRLVGRNVVGVLSTIMLFSYSKLVGTSVKALSFMNLDIIYNHSKIDTILVWPEDGKIKYFQGKHIPLGIVASILCAISLLYTLSLLFIQCLQRRSNWFILRWVEKLRPFFDVNTGPCRDNYRFWPGFLLFTRFVLLFFNIYHQISFYHKLYSVIGFCVIIFLLACVSPHGMYKKWPLNILEFSFYLNLGMLSTLVVTLDKEIPRIVFTAPSVGIFAMTFFCILVYHCYKRVRGTRTCKKYARRFRRRGHNQDPYAIIQEQGSNVQDNERDVAVDDEQSPIVQGMPPVVRYDQLREPLLA